MSAYDAVKPFRFSSDAKGFGVIATSLLPYIVSLCISYLLMSQSYWWVLLLAIPTHWFHARMFIVLHDCGHHSLFKSRALNDLFGHVCSFFYYTPFFMWRELHNKHHSHQGNLAKRGLSLDVWILTKAEYAALTAFRKLCYRFYHNPLTILAVSPLLLFFLIFRLPFEKFSTRAVINILALDAVLFWLIYFQPDFFMAFFKVQLPSLLISFSMASFLFYVQHQFENTLWLQDSDYSNEQIALKGSSFLNLPPFLMWTYGNIAYHHIHHLDVKIPMYNLPTAHRQLPLPTSTLSLKQIVKCLARPPLV